MYFLLPYKELNALCLIVMFILFLPYLFKFQSKNRWDSRIGELSYPIYISHMLVIWSAGFILGIDHSSLVGSLIIVFITVIFSQIINLIYNSNYVIGNESGPICIGAALKKKVISIYYPKHTNKSSKTIYNKVKFFNSDKISSQKIISNILKNIR